MNTPAAGKATWQSKKVKFLPIEIIDGDRSSKYPKRSEIHTEGVLFLNTKNIVQNRLDLSDADFVTSEKFAQIKKGRLRPMDIVMTTRGSIGKVALFNNPTYPTGLINAQMLILRPDGQTVDSRFLFYLLCSADFQDSVRNYASGSAQPQIPVRDLQEIEVPCPPLPTQRKIASILSAYDDLIENNVRRIEILEEMAQRIYWEWFINFRFPGHEKVRMVDSELGPIPEGWEVRRVKGVLKRLKAGSTYKEADVVEEGQVPVIDQSQKNFLGFHNNLSDHIASPQEPIVIFGDHTCKMQLMVEPFSISPNVVPFISPNETPILFLYFLVRNLVETREYKRHWNELINKRVAFPPSNLTNAFSSVTTPVFERINLSSKANLNLFRTRNLLLPKLISGEVSVEELDVDPEITRRSLA